jgi:hypothetical protein
MSCASSASRQNRAGAARHITLYFHAVSKLVETDGFSDYRRSPE